MATLAGGGDFLGRQSVAGAAILSVASWHLFFWCNVPLGIIAQKHLLRSLPETPKPTHRFDLISALLNAATFGLLLVGLDGIGQGQDSASVVQSCWLERRRRSSSSAYSPRMVAPMLPVDLFRAVGAYFARSFAAQTSAYLALLFSFALAGGMSQSQIGLLITPGPAAVVFVSPIAGRLSA